MFSTSNTRATITRGIASFAALVMVYSFAGSTQAGAQARVIRPTGAPVRRGSNNPNIPRNGGGTIQGGGGTFRNGGGMVRQVPNNPNNPNNPGGATRQFPNNPNLNGGAVRQVPNNPNLNRGTTTFQNSNGTFQSSGGTTRQIPNHPSFPGRTIRRP